MVWQESLSAMDEYLRLLRLKHDERLKTPENRDCGGADLTCHDYGDHVAVYCDDCGVLLDRKYRQQGGEEVDA